MNDTSTNFSSHHHHSNNNREHILDTNHDTNNSSNNNRELMMPTTPIMTAPFTIPTSSSSGNFSTISSQSSTPNPYSQCNTPVLKFEPLRKKSTKASVELMDELEATTSMNTTSNLTLTQDSLTEQLASTNNGALIRNFSRHDVNSLNSNGNTTTQTTSSIAIDIEDQVLAAVYESKDKSNNNIKKRHSTKEKDSTHHLLSRDKDKDRDRETSASASAPPSRQQLRHGSSFKDKAAVTKDKDNSSNGNKSKGWGNSNGNTDMRKDMSPLHRDNTSGISSVDNDDVMGSGSTNTLLRESTPKSKDKEGKMSILANAGSNTVSNSNTGGNIETNSFPFAVRSTKPVIHVDHH